MVGGPDHISALVDEGNTINLLLSWTSRWCKYFEEHAYKEPYLWHHACRYIPATKLGRARSSSPLVTQATSRWRKPPSMWYIMTCTRISCFPTKCWSSSWFHPLYLCGGQDAPRGSILISVEVKEVMHYETTMSLTWQTLWLAAQGWLRSWSPLGVGLDWG